MSQPKYHVELLSRYLTTGNSLVNVSACIVYGQKPLGEIDWKSNDPSLQFSQVKTSAEMEMTTILQIIPTQAHNSKPVFCEGNHPIFGKYHVNDLVLHVAARSNIFLVLVVTFAVFGILMLTVFGCVYYVRKHSEKQAYQESQIYTGNVSTMQHGSKTTFYSQGNINTNLLSRSNNKLPNTLFVSEFNASPSTSTVGISDYSLLPLSNVKTPTSSFTQIFGSVPSKTKGLYK